MTAVGTRVHEPRSWPRVAAALMVCAPALAGGGGGSPEAKPDGPQLVARVASTTAAAKTSTVFVSLVASGSPDGSGRVDGFGAVDLVGGRVDLNLYLAGL